LLRLGVDLRSTAKKLFHIPSPLAGEGRVRGIMAWIPSIHPHPIPLPSRERELRNSL